MPPVSSAVRIRLEPNELIKAINDMKKKERDAFLGRPACVYIAGIS